MRQPGTEFNIDPFEAFVAEAIELPEIPQNMQQNHQRWLDNTARSKQHRFCANQCLDFLQAGGINANETACMTTCFSKYSQAFSSYKYEKNLFFKNLDDIKARGGNEFEYRNI